MNRAFLIAAFVLCVLGTAGTTAIAACLVALVLFRVMVLNDA